MKRTINTTLVLIFQNNKVLLAQKKRGFAQGTFNGIGGKQDPGETIEQAMVRETQEEIGVTPTKYSQVGLIRFDTWYKGERVDLNLNIFTCSDFVGEIEETEEMIPEWFEIENVPFDKMLPDDKEWFPIVVEGGNVYGTVFLEEDLKHSINNFKVVSKDELETQIQNLYGSSEASEIAK